MRALTLILLLAGLCACARTSASVSPRPSAPEPPSTELPVELENVSVESKKASIGPRKAQYFDEVRYDGASSPDFQVHTYATRGERELRLFVFGARPAARAAAILLLHSGGWTRGRPEWLFGLAQQLSGRGLVAVSVEYRLSADGITPFDAFVDTCDAFRWVRRHAAELGIDPHRIAGWGASAGGQLVAATATPGCPDAPDGISGRPDALLLVSAGVDPGRSPQYRKLIGEGADPNRDSPLAHLRAGLPPTLYIAGAEDTITTLEQSRAYCEGAAALGNDCTLVVYPGLGHLLTKDLTDQRASLAPDPDAEARAYDEQEAFLRRIGFLEAPERHATPRGTEIEVLTERPPGSGPFPIVVLAPGSGYHMRLPLLERVARTLVDSGIGVFRFDWSYFVHDPVAGRQSEDRLDEIEDLETVLRLARAAPWSDRRNVFVAGKSLGSIIAWRVLRRDPTLAGALLLTPVCNKPTPSATYPELTYEQRPTAWLLGDRDPVCATRTLYRFLADAPSTTHLTVLAGNHSFETGSPPEAESNPKTLRRFDLAATSVATFVQEQLRMEAAMTQQVTP